MVLADAETIRRTAADPYMGDTVTRQLDDANIVLLNKADLVDAAALAETRAWLATQAPHARVVETAHGVVPPSTVLESFLERAHAPGPHHEATHLDMLTLRPTGPLDVDRLAAALADPRHGLIRAKGFATGLDGHRALIQVVGQRWQTGPADAGRTDGIVCLGFKGVLDPAALAGLIGQ